MHGAVACGRSGLQGKGEPVRGSLSIDARAALDTRAVAEARAAALDEARGVAPNAYALSVRSAIIADEPVIDAAEPAPTSKRNPSTAGSPADMVRPVPIDPMAVTTVPHRMSGTRPTESASRPSGMLNTRRAIGGAASSAPTLVALNPMSIANNGSTGTTWETPTFSKTWEPTRIPTCRRSVSSCQKEFPAVGDSSALRGDGLVDS